MKYYLPVFLSVMVCFVKISAQNVSYTSLFTDASFNAKTIDIVKPVGKTEGAASVSSGGGATYSIPIKIPAGINGLIPSIGVMYNSQGGSGILGMGWNLTGSSAITRGGDNIYHDGIVTPVDYSNNDNFYLDGVRLYVVSGNNGADNTTYSTEAESYSTIISHGNINNAPDWFEVITKDGSNYKYSVKFLSDDGTKTMLWQLARITDVTGNSIDFTYTQYDRQNLLTKINYAKNDANGKPAKSIINFSYALRSDINKLYEAGASVTSKYLLTSISTLADVTNAYSTYNFNYGYDNLNSYLVEVVEKGNDNSQLNSTIFKYGDAPLNLSTGYDIGAYTNQSDLFAGDFNGDGVSDVLAAHVKYDNLYIKHHDSYSLYKDIGNDASNLMYSVSIPNSNYSGGLVDGVYNKDSKTASYGQDVVFSSDYDADGRDDVIYYTTNSVNINDHTTSKLSNVIINYTKSYNSQTQLYDYTNQSFPYPAQFNIDYNYINQNGNFFFPGDFDGDGRPDYILLTSSCDCNGYKAFFTCPKTGETNLEIGDFGVGSFSNYFASTVANADKVIPVDWDGDGKQDFLVVNSYGSYILKVFRTSITSGYYFAASNTFIGGIINKDCKILTGDFNGDKKTDILFRVSTGQWYVTFSTGTSFSGNYAFNFNQTVHLDGNYYDDKLIIADFNGDGLSDILHGYVNLNGSTSSLSFYYSKGLNTKSFSQSFYYEQYTYNSALTFAPLAVGDFNGDGRNDFIDWSNGGANVLYIKPKGQERLIDKIADGFDKVTDFDYDLLTDNNGNYARTITQDNPLNNYPFNYIREPLLTISDVTIPDGIGGTSTTKYSYQDAVYHRAGKGFLGFKNITVTNATHNIISSSQNDLNTQYALLVPSLSTNTVKTSGNNISSSQTFTSFQNLGTGIQKRYSMHIDKTLNTDYLHKSAVESSNTYDNYGNVTINTTKAGSITNVSTSPVQTTVTNTTFGIHNTPVPAMPENITVTQTRNGSPSLSNTTTFTYTALGQVQTKTEFSGLPKAVTATYSYDAVGNVSTAILSASGEANRGTKFTYETGGRFVTKKELTGATNNTLQSETYNINLIWGLPNSVISSDCLTTSYQYDGFGRLIKTTVPQGWDINKTLVWNVANGYIFYEQTSASFNPDVKEYYDILGRKTKVLTKGFNNNQWMTQLTTYDNQGRSATGTNNYYSSETPLTTTYAYDSYDRITNASNTLGTTSYSYAANGTGVLTTTTTLADGNITLKDEDAAGLIIYSTDNGGTISYNYDSRGNQTEVKLGGKSLLTNVYDEYGLKFYNIDINAGTHYTRYDAWGNLLKTGPGDGTYVTLDYVRYYYDELNRVTSESHPVFNNLTYNYTYYNNVNTSCANNNVNSITGTNNINKTFTYDTYQRLQTETTTIDATDYTTQYNYNNGNQLTKVTYPSSVVVNYTYDANGNQLTATLGSGTPLFTANNMNGFGEYTDYTLGNGKQSLNTYNYGTPTRYYTQGIQDLNFTFDYTNGNLTKRVDNIKTKTENFTYDNLNRLLTWKVNGGTQNSLTYDAVGNKSYGNIITKSDAGNYIYDNSQINAVKFISNSSNATLPPPNISSNTQNIAYEYDFSKTKTITENNYQLDYTYGPDDDRLKSVLQQSGSVTQTRYYFGDYEKQIAGGATKQIHYIAAGNGLCAIVVRQGGVNTVYYAYTDYLGSILTLTDAAGTVVAEQNFDPWGRKRNPTTWMYTNVPAVPDWLYRGYTGHEHVPQFGLINMNARMYDPVVGRMLSVDNYVGDPFNTQAYNRYGYGLNNPNKYIDPDGNNPLIIAAIIGGIINLAFHAGDIHSFGDALGYFVVGAGAGALTAGIGSGISSALAGGSFGAGFIGSSSALTATSSFWNGVLIGGAAGFAGGFTSSLGNNIIGGENLGTSLKSAAIEGLYGGIAGGIAGGVFQGIDAMKDGRRFFDGATVKTQVIASQNIPYVPQNSEYNCGPSNVAAVDQSYGGSLTQNNVRGWYPNTNPNTDGVGDIPMWKKYGHDYGHLVVSEAPPQVSNIESIPVQMQAGTRITFNIRTNEPNIGHSVTLSSVANKTITKISGRIINRLIYYAMDPSVGYRTISLREMSNAYRMFFIH